MNTKIKKSIERVRPQSSIPGVQIRIALWTLVLMLFLAGCTDFVEVDLPQNQLTSETVFEDPATTQAALRDIYAKMRDGGLVSSLDSNMGLYADELDSYSSVLDDFYNHTILVSNGAVLSWWNNSYNLIFAANAVVEGVGNSKGLDMEDRDLFLGEGLFVRAYLHLLLVEIFGPVPYITTTDYIANAEVSRMPVDLVYGQIIDDLNQASQLLGTDVSGEKVRPYKAVADALLARAYLNIGQWEDAERMSSMVIGSLAWEPNLNRVFLKEASSTIWQFKPEFEGDNTSDGSNYILIGVPLNYALSDDLYGTFEPGDQRRSSWVGSYSDGTETWYFPFKYKERMRTFMVNAQNQEVPTSLEYPVVFRLAEQYLIRAEARAQQGDIAGSQSDLNMVRNRAGLPNTVAASKDDLLDKILEERRVELFTEQGHRWFDLKRTDRAAQTLSGIKIGWQDTNVLLPVPESELLANPNLLPQNDGY